MYSTRFANTFTRETTVSGSETVLFPSNSGQIIVTNDSTTTNLTVRLTGGGDQLTLKPNEALNVYYRTSGMVLAGNDVPYRLWVFS